MDVEGGKVVGMEGEVVASPDARCCLSENFLATDCPSPEHWRLDPLGLSSSIFRHRRRSLVVKPDVVDIAQE